MTADHWQTNEKHSESMQYVRSDERVRRDSLDMGMLFFLLVHFTSVLPTYAHDCIMPSILPEIMTSRQAYMTAISTHSMVFSTEMKIPIYPFSLRNASMSGLNFSGCSEKQKCPPGISTSLLPDIVLLNMTPSSAYGVTASSLP